MAPSSNTATNGKGKSKIITLHLRDELLRKFPYEATPSAIPSSPSSSNVDSTAQATATANTPDPSASASGLLAPPNPMKRKGIPGPKPGMKRTSSQANIDGLPKPRGKPGPKKKMRVDNVNGTLVPVNAPKLNPKASAGAINANLRALDRTGKPCRRWTRAPFTIKSFTGQAWASGSWGASKRPATPVDENGNPINGDKSDASATPSEAATKQHQDSSALPSEKSVNGDADTPMPTIAEAVASSPALIAA
ncbi:hypothetical protein BT63DRAFT_278509 [Microthyrium microscopicum]|uniref:INO80 complex, subunit Ies4 n=1 Tax=Microthyrium microscopicum TaxID=703497 RepID=A0A6A6U8J6_9PEZI|nr:hypothetical protein BT63DRAFT_278509 [Microthyrium microscopicum]